MKKASSTGNGLTPNQLWLSLFGLWFIFLSGLLTPLVGTPGIIQAVRLKHIVQAKQEQFDQAEAALLKAQDEASLLEKSKLVQHREIRKVLGYTAPNELVFDFAI